MKTTALLAGVCALTTFGNAMALDLTPYAAVRAGVVLNQADADVASVYKYKRAFENVLADEKHSDNVFGARAAFGVSADFEKYGAVRAELELNWNDRATDSHDFDFKILNTYTHNFKTKTETYGAMANLYYDVYTGTKFTPFIGVGAGVSHVKISSVVRGEIGGEMARFDGSKSDNNFAWNVGAGLAYDVSDSIVLDIMYRYTDLGTIKSTDVRKLSGAKGDLTTDAKFNVISHEFMAGARYRF